MLLAQARSNAKQFVWTFLIFLFIPGRSRFLISIVTFEENCKRLQLLIRGRYLLDYSSCLPRSAPLSSTRRSKAGFFHCLSACWHFLIGLRSNANSCFIPGRSRFLISIVTFEENCKRLQLLIRGRYLLDYSNCLPRSAPLSSARRKLGYCVTSLEMGHIDKN